MVSDHQSAIIKAFQTVGEIKERLDLEKRLIREARREGGGLSQRQRIIQWGLENPEVIFTPSIAKTGLDASGIVRVNFPKVPYKTFHKRLIGQLVKDGIFIKYLDPKEHFPVRGHYKFNSNYGIDEGSILPREEFHNLKVEIKEPIKADRDGKGKRRKRSANPYLTRAIIEDNKRFKFRLIKNSQEHTWTFKSIWRNRTWTINVNHGKSRLIEMWLSCSENPLPPEEFADWIDDIELLFPDVIPHSEPVLRIYDINRDFEGMSLPVNQEIKLDIAKEYFIRVYQKGKRVRSELCGIQPMDLLGLKACIRDRSFAMEKLEIVGELQKISRYVKDADDRISKYNDILESLGYQVEANTLQSLKGTNAVNEFLEILRELVPKREEKSPVSLFKTAQEMVDPPGYG